MGPHRPLTSLNDYGWRNPILIDKSPQPYYRLNPNTYINRLQPDLLVGVSGGVNETTHCVLLHNLSLFTYFRVTSSTRYHLVACVHYHPDTSPRWINFIASNSSMAQQNMDEGPHDEHKQILYL